MPLETAEDGRQRADTEMARRLVAAQFPHWAHLPVQPVASGGWDNVTFRLGEDLTLRLPTAERYVPQIEKELVWLPRLAAHLPLPIPEPVGKGEPGQGFPWPWSICRWIEGESAVIAQIADRNAFAVSLAGFLLDLQSIDATGGPEAGPHNFHRGGALAVYDQEATRAIAENRAGADPALLTDIWRLALETRWSAAPIWVHGDVAPGNLLCRVGHLTAVIDFGSCATGDPACDLVIAWTMLEGEAREVFKRSMSLDAGTWQRARGWALWKAAITLAGPSGADSAVSASAKSVIQALAGEHRTAGKQAR